MNYLEIAGALIGLLYLWFEYRASIWLWPVSVIMPAIYIVVYYQVGLYADSVISIYYLLAGIYGWWMWLRHTPDKGEKPVSGTPSKLLLPMFVVLLVVFVLIGIILETCTDSTVPWWDSLQQHLVLLPCGCLHINMWNNGWHGWLLMLFLVVSIFTKIYISLLFCMDFMR
jgi:nicotinamide mononucleotide transporter